MKLYDIPMIPARHYTPANRTKVDLIVLHTTENKQRPGLAKDVALWFASRLSSRASCHYVVDDAEVFRCVLETDVSWCGPGSNANGIHIEHCGQASQSWDDDYSRKMLLRSVDLAAQLCLKWSIPPVLLSADGLTQKLRGITTHAAVSEAFKKSNHTDPGPFFPVDWYVTSVEMRMCELDR